MFSVAIVVVGDHCVETMVEQSCKYSEMIFLVLRAEVRVPISRRP